MSILEHLLIAIHDIKCMATYNDIADANCLFLLLLMNITRHFYILDSKHAHYGYAYLFCVSSPTRLYIQVYNAYQL